MRLSTNDVDWQQLPASTGSSSNIHDGHPVLVITIANHHLRRSLRILLATIDAYLYGELRHCAAVLTPYNLKSNAVDTCFSHEYEFHAQIAFLVCCLLLAIEPSTAISAFGFSAILVGHALAMRPTSAEEGRTAGIMALFFQFLMPADFQTHQELIVCSGACFSAFLRYASQLSRPGDKSRYSQKP